MLSHSASVATYDVTINRSITMLLKNYEMNEMFEYFVSIFWNLNKLSKYYKIIYTLLSPDNIISCFEFAVAQTS